MAITASMVKTLRERTGVGMMECKKALVEADGDMDAAAKLLREKGQAKADKKAGRVAAEGRIVVAHGDGASALIEVNCETDFVAADDNFVQFATAVGNLVATERPADLDALMALTIDGATVEEARTALVAKIGENIGVRRFAFVESAGGVIGSYTHNDRIGALVAVTDGDEDLGRDIAMHVAASSPVCVDENDVPEETLAAEREILVNQAKDSGKPDEIIQKMVDGRMRKYLAEITLVGQPFVKDPDVTVGKLLKQAGASVSAFLRFEVGEGIEKKEDNFAEEVMAQVKAASESDDDE
ncbi:MAG: translation elongation factor Ts [Pseudomonadota bacterium]